MVRQDPLPWPMEVKVTHSGEKTNATNVDSSRQFEETFESTQWGKVKRQAI